MNPKRWVARLGLCLVMWCVALGASANAPKAIRLEFAQAMGMTSGTLTVVVEHPSGKVRRHYVDRIRLYVDGKRREERRYQSQTDTAGFRDTFLLKDLRGGEKVRVRATCSIYGAESESIAIPPIVVSEKPKVGLLRRVVATIVRILPGTEAVQIHSTTARGPSVILSVGVEAPNFPFMESTGAPLSLSMYRDKKNVLVVFYMGDDNPEDVQMLEDLRGAYPRYEAADVLVLGVSPDPPSSHIRLAREARLPFPLVSDPAKAIAMSYGCVGADGNILRTVYGIDLGGKIVLAERDHPVLRRMLAAFRAAR